MVLFCSPCPGLLGSCSHKVEKFQFQRKGDGGSLQARVLNMGPKACKFGELGSLTASLEISGGLQKLRLSNSCRRDGDQQVT